MSTQRSPLHITRVPTGVYPLFLIMGTMLTGLATFAIHAVKGPDVVLARKSNPKPWESIKEGETTKMWNPHGRFQSYWSRDKL